MCTRRFTSKNERGENALLLVQGHSESHETWEIASNPEYMTAPGVRIGAVEITGTAIDRFAELERRAGWVSVNDKLPIKEGDYLCYYNNGNVTIRHCYAYDPFGFAASGFTHWMELPAPPTETE